MVVPRARYASVSAIRRSAPRGRGIPGETKSVDIPSAVFSQLFSAGNSASQSLTLIQSGAEVYNRIGRKTALTSLQITAQVQDQGAVAALAEETLRYIIFYDKQPNGVAATWNQVVQSIDNAGGVTNTVWDATNLDQRDRFIILRDRKIVVPRTSATGFPTSMPYGTSSSSVGASNGSDGGCLIKEYIKLGRMEAQFSGTANPATVAQVVTGNLAVVTQGSVGGQYSLFGSARVRFTDN